MDFFSRSLDFNGETFEQRFKRMPEMMTRKDLITLRLFSNLKEVDFAVLRNKIPYVRRGYLLHFPKREIKKWLKYRY